jgi:hypothetical protein
MTLKVALFWCYRLDAGFLRLRLSSNGAIGNYMPIAAQLN